VFLPAPVEKEPTTLVIGPAPDEKGLPPTYLPPPVEKELAPLVIWLAPDEKEQTPVTCVPAGPCGVGAGPPGHQASP